MKTRTYLVLLILLVGCTPPPDHAKLEPSCNESGTIQNGSIEKYGRPYGIRADRTETGYWENATTLRYQGTPHEKSSWFTVHYPSSTQPQINVTRLPFSFASVSYTANPMGNSIGNVFSVKTLQGTDIHISLAKTTDSSELSFQYGGSTYAFKGQSCVLHFNSTNHLTQILSGNLDQISIDGTALIDRSGSSVTINENNDLQAVTLNVAEDPFGSNALKLIYIGTRLVPSSLLPVWNNAINLYPQILEGNF